MADGVRISAAGRAAAVLVPALLLAAPATAARQPPQASQLYRAAVYCAAVEAPLPGGWDETGDRMEADRRSFERTAYSLGGRLGVSSDRVARDIEVRRNALQIEYGRSGNDMGWQKGNIEQLRKPCSRADAG